MHFLLRRSDTASLNFPFNVVDDFNRELVAIEVDFNLPAKRVVRTLVRIAATRGYPLKLRLDSGPEFVSVVPTENSIRPANN